MNFSLPAVSYTYFVYSSIWSIKAVGILNVSEYPYGYQCHLFLHYKPFIFIVLQGPEGLLPLLFINLERLWQMVFTLNKKIHFCSYCTWWYETINVQNTDSNEFAPFVHTHFHFLVTCFFFIYFILVNNCISLYFSLVTGVSKNDGAKKSLECSSPLYVLYILIFFKIEDIWCHFIIF